MRKNQDEVLEALRATYTCQDKQLRNKAQQKLSYYSQDPEFINHICSLLKCNLSTLVPDPSEIKLALLNYLHKFVSRLFMVSSSFNSQLKNTVMQKLIGCLFSQQLDHQTKLQIVSTMAVALVNDQGVHSYSTNMIARAGLALKDNQLVLADYLVYAVVLGHKDLNTTVAVYRKCFEGMREAVGKRVAGIAQVLAEWDGGEIKVQGFTKAVEEVEFTLKVILAEIRLLQFDKHKLTCTDLVKDTKLFQMFNQILSLAPPGHRSLILSIPNPQITHLNSLRTYTLQSLYLLFKGIRQRSFKLQPLPHIRTLHQQHISWCISQLPTILPTPDTQHHRIVQLCLQILSIAARHNEFHEPFVRYRERLLEIVFGLFVRPEPKRELLMEDPEEYLRVLEDVCERQSVDTPKSAAVRLMEAMCDKVDGTLTVLWRRAVGMIQLALRAVAGEDPGLVVQDDTISSMKNSFFWQKSTDQHKISTGLDILSTISYLADKRKDLSTSLQSLIQTHLNFFLNYQSNPHLTISFMNMYSYYADAIFLPQKLLNPTLQTIIVFLLQKMTTMGEGAAQGLRLAAFDALSNILCETIFTEVFGRHIVGILEEMVKGLGMPEAHKVLELVGDLMVLYAKFVVVDKEKFLRNLAVLEGVIKREVSADVQKTILLDNYFNLIDKLIECKEYYPYLDDIYTGMKPALIMLSTRNNYHDNILSIFNSFMKQTKSVKPQIQYILQHSQQIINWNKGSMHRLFQTFNLTAIYSQSPSTHHQLFQLSLTALSNFTQDTIPTDLLQGCLIMQLLLFYHSRSFPTPAKQLLLQTITQLLHTHHVVLDSELYSKYLLLILQLMNSDFSMVSQELTKMDRQADTAEMLYASAKHYKEDLYDAKVFVINQVGLLEKYMREFGEEVACSSFRIVVELVRALYERDGEYGRGNDRDSESDSSQDDDSQDKKGTEIMDTYQSIMRVFMSPYKHMDEFVVFKKYIDKLRENEQDNQRFNYLVMRLPEDLREFLKTTALFIQKIRSDAGVMPRKIVKVKRS